MFDDIHLYATVIGDSYNSTERWQFGFRMTAGALPNDPPTVAAALAPVVRTWWELAAPNQYFGAVTTHRLVEIKVALIGKDGHYVPNTVPASYFYNPPVAGLEAVPAGQLAQNSIAATLTTATPRGLASKGRIFLPPSSRQLPLADGLLSANLAASIANSVKTLINNINGLPSVGDVAVFSRGKRVRGPNLPNGKWTWTFPNPGATHLVTGVSVGRVVDTQRRRRRKLAELPQKSTV